MPSYSSDNLNLAIETSSPTFNQWYVGSKTHLVDMSSSIQIIQRIEYNMELFKPANIELSFFNVRMIGFKVDVWIEFASCVLGDLLKESELLRKWVSTVKTNQGLRLLNVLMSEQKLAVEIAQVDGVEVNNMDFHESSEDEILKKFATDATCAYQ